MPNAIFHLLKGDHRALRVQGAGSTIEVEGLDSTIAVRFRGFRIYNKSLPEPQQ